MSSWQYAFLFPQLPSQLRPANAVKRLTEFGADFDGSIRMCVPVDDQGHVLDVGDEIALREPFERDLIRHLEIGKSFSIQLRHPDLVISAEFLLDAPNPHISLGWSRRLFKESPLMIQRDFWRVLRSFAKDCNAGYVVIVDDAPDHFEDRFIDIDGKRMFDLRLNHRYELGLREVWLQSSVTSTLPEGATYGDSEQLGDGFERYFVTM
ncbi:hypothetical protein [Schlesneria paludicola]|uniref:hypothetical protein n=1 Tax=Schlesneria paludicola TaxID=360056 RepID=UPI0012FC80F8|nr:hypothetical protein [Schlesneria paludicola]